MLKYIGNILFCCGDIIFEKKLSSLHALIIMLFFFKGWMTNLRILVNEVFVLNIFFFSQSNHYRLSGRDCLTCYLDFFFFLRFVKT